MHLPQWKCYKPSKDSSLFTVQRALDRIDTHKDVRGILRRKAGPANTVLVMVMGVRPANRYRVIRLVALIAKPFCMVWLEATPLSSD